MRNHILATFLSGALLAAPGTAFAFQELPAAPEPETTIVVPGEKGHALTDDERAKPAKTAEKKDRAFKIPGIGSLDFLPKLDFGLDVMYGAPPEPATPETAVPDTRGDDMTIRGTVKRRF